MVQQCVMRLSAIKENWPHHRGLIFTYIVWWFWWNGLIWWFHWGFFFVEGDSHSLWPHCHQLDHHQLVHRGRPIGGYQWPLLPCRLDHAEQRSHWGYFHLYPSTCTSVLKGYTSWNWGWGVLFHCSLQLKMALIMAMGLPVAYIENWVAMVVPTVLLYCFAIFVCTYYSSTIIVIVYLKI